jgi:hypothetical protein
MHFYFLAIVAALTASVSVSACQEIKALPGERRLLLGVLLGECDYE